MVQMRKGCIVANQKQQGPLDKLSNRLREILDAADRLLNPPQPKRVPVPVPVRVPRPQDNRRYPYGR